MSNAKKCDRCGKLYELYEGYDVGNKYNTLTLSHHWNTVSRKYDLCPECMVSLIDWIKEVDNEC